MKRPLLLILALLLFVGCKRASFNVDEDINGQNPGSARFPVFGQFIDDLDGEGDEEDLVLFIYSSSGRRPCEEVADGAINSQEIVNGLMVFVQVVAFDVGVPEEGTVFSNSEDGQNILVAFIAGDGEENTAITINNFNGDDGSLFELLTFRDSDVIKAEVSSTLVSDLTDPLNEIEIDVPIEGSFKAGHCQALSDLLLE